MGQWLNVQALLQDFTPQSIPCGPFTAPGSRLLGNHLPLRCTPQALDCNGGGEPGAPQLPSAARVCTWVKEGRLPRAPRRSQVLGRRTRQGATPGRASPTRDPLRFPRRPPDLKAALRTRGWVRRRSGPSPTPHRQERTAPGAPWPGSTSPLTGSHRGRRKDRPVRNTQASPTRTLNGRSPTPPGPPLFGCSEPWGHASDLRAREPPEARRRQSAACRFADRALALSRALSLGQWGYPQSRGRLHRSGGAAVSSGRCLAAILCVAEAGLLVD